MSKFDTHGGYFAPKDYLRVNEGGSHEENPNGGVQVGVDPEGTPNLLEEGEPVYKDYVYSDNIEAEKEFLEQNHLPAKYAGKLYSKIADDLFFEAEERPLDPISRNGLEALLGRLADAQEGQKQAKEQRDLEDELAQLSPEELDQLEAMLAQGEQGQMPPEQMPMDAVPEQMVGSAEPVPVEGMPMMANGGFLRMFQGGGSMDDDINKRIAEARKRRNSIEEKEESPGRSLTQTMFALGARRLTNLLDFGQSRKYYEKQKRALDNMLEDYASGKDYGGAYNPEDAIRHQAEHVEKLKSKMDAREQKEQDLLWERRDAEKRANAIRFPFAQSFVPVDGYDPVTSEEPLPAGSQAVNGGSGEGITQIDTLGTSWDWGISDIDLGQYKYGGLLGNKYPDGGWLDFLKRLNAYTGSSGRSNADRHYAIDRNSAFWNNRTGKEVEAGELYDPFTQYVLSHAEGENIDPMIMEYFRSLDNVINKETGVPLLIDPNTGKLNSNWKSLFLGRRTDGDLGAYHLNPDADFWTAMSAPPVAPSRPASVSKPASLQPVSGPLFDFTERTSYSPDGANLGMPEFKLHVPQSALEADTMFRLGRGDTRPFHDVYENTVVDFADRAPGSGNDGSTNVNPNRPYAPLPVWPRYAGAVGSGLLGLYNAFQSPDRYAATRINPQVPEGRINLQNQAYNPIDQNMVANAQIAQGNATNRALRNSGLGVSAASAILAADNNTTGNLGTGFIQAWDANNQRRNAVIAANNQSEAQRAQFDYTVDAARKDAFNRIAPYNAQNNLMIQRLNNQAEADKYTAISNQIGNGLQALSGIGQENFAMNQVNTNPAYLGYRVGPNGAMFYNPYTGKWEKVKS